MIKELLIFGAYGGLGNGVSKSFVEKDYDHIYLFDMEIPDKKFKAENISNIEVKDLTEEKNVIEALKKVDPGKDKQLFLYSTVGGFAGGNKLWETGEDEWNKMMDMNLKSNFFIAKHFAPLIKESDSGSICFTAAFTGINAEKGKTAYGASKGALIHLVETLSKEGEEIRLSVNAIAPFIIDTYANREWMKEEDYNKWNKPEEIGNLAHSIFLNFHFITGNIIKLSNRFPIS